MDRSTYAILKPKFYTRRAPHWNGEFSLENGWSNAKVEKLITDLLMYLQHVDKRGSAFLPPHSMWGAPSETM